MFLVIFGGIGKEEICNKTLYMYMYVDTYIFKTRKDFALFGLCCCNRMGMLTDFDIFRKRRHEQT